MRNIIDNFFCDFALPHTLNEQISTKSLRLDQNNLRQKN